MAKKSKYGEDYSATSSDDPRDDGDYAAKPSVDTQDSEPAPGTSPDDGTKYTVVEEGTVINGVYFPYSDAAPGQEMNVYLSETDAAELVRCGVKLNNEDSSPVEAGADPNAETDPDVDEGQPIVA